MILKYFTDFSSKKTVFYKEFQTEDWELSIQKWPCCHFLKVLSQNKFKQQIFMWLYIQTEYSDEIFKDLNLFKIPVNA